MEKKSFNIRIDAPRETVWNILWGDATYPQWASAFMEGSRAETDWQEGSRVLFVDAKKDGMIAVIDKSISHEYMSFRTVGEITNGVEKLANASDQEWAGALENYTLKTVDGKTELTIDQDLADQHVDYFVEVWPRALEKIKELAEK